MEAGDEDCSLHFGNICGYDIESPGQPFSISKEGTNLSRDALVITCFEFEIYLRKHFKFFILGFLCFENLIVFLTLIFHFQ